MSMRPCEKVGDYVLTQNIPLRLFHYQGRACSKSRWRWLDLWPERVTRKCDLIVTTPGLHSWLFRVASFPDVAFLAALQFRPQLPGRQYGILASGSPVELFNCDCTEHHIWDQSISNWWTSVRFLHTAGDMQDSSLPLRHKLEATQTLSSSQSTKISSAWSWYDPGGASIFKSK